MLSVDELRCQLRFLMNMYPNIFVKYPDVMKIVLMMKKHQNVDLYRPFSGRGNYLDALIPYIDHTRPKFYDNCPEEGNPNYASLKVEFGDVVYYIAITPEGKTFWVIV